MRFVLTVPMGCWVLAAALAAQGPALQVRLPEGRLPARRALAVLDRVTAELGTAVRIELSWPDPALRAAVGRGLPPGVVGGLAAAARPEVADRAGDGSAVWVLPGGERLPLSLDEGLVEDARDLRRGLRPRRLLAAHLVAVRAAEGPAGLPRTVLQAAAELGDRPVQAGTVLAAALEVAPAISRDPDLLRLCDRLLDAAPRSEVVQQAAFRARLLAGEHAAARQAGFAWLESGKGRPGALAARIDVLRALDPEQDQHDLWDAVFDLVLDLGPELDPALLRQAFEDRLRRVGDLVQAGRIGRRYLDLLGADAARLNGFAWQLLTEEAYAGRLDGLALEAARRMDGDPAWRTSWRLDTLALACFRNGLLDEAVALQAEAVEKADAGARPRYAERRAAYAAAARAAPARPAR
jgi:hypothetical protein